MEATFSIFLTLHVLVTVVTGVLLIFILILLTIFLPQTSTFAGASAHRELATQGPIVSNITIICLVTLRRNWLRCPISVRLIREEET